jgi:hypothetical protein
MKANDTGKAIEAMASYLNNSMSASDLSAKLRTASAKLSCYLIQDDDVNGQYAQEMADLIYILNDLSDRLQ